MGRSRIFSATTMNKATFVCWRIYPSRNNHPEIARGKRKKRWHCVQPVSEPVLLAGQTEALTIRL